MWPLVRLHPFDLSGEEHLRMSGHVDIRFEHLQLAERRQSIVDERESNKQNWKKEEARANKLTTQLKTTQEKLASTEKALDETKSELVAMTAKATEQQQRADTLQANLDNTKRDLTATQQDLAAWNQELKAAGARVFSAGLHPPSTATVVRVKNGEMLTTDGPFAEGKEYLGGFTIIRAEDLDSALEWGRKLARVTTLPIEVRPFQDGPQG